MTRNIRLHSRNAFIIVGRVRPVRFGQKFRAAFFPKTNGIPSFQKRALTVGLRGTSRGYWPIANVPGRAVLRRAAPHHTTPHHTTSPASSRLASCRAMPIRGRAAPRRAGVNAALGVSRPPSRSPRGLLRRLLLSSRSLSFFPLFYMRLARPSGDLSFAEGAQARGGGRERERGRGQGRGERRGGSAGRGGRRRERKR